MPISGVTREVGMLSTESEGFSTKALKVSRERLHSSSSQFAPTECADTKLFTSKVLLEVMNVEHVEFILRTP